MKFNFEISHASAEEKRRIRRRRERTPKKVGEKREKRGERRIISAHFSSPDADRPSVPTHESTLLLLGNHQFVWEFGVGESRFNNRPPRG